MDPELNDVEIRDSEGGKLCWSYHARPSTGNLLKADERDKTNDIERKIAPSMKNSGGQKGYFNSES